MLAGAEQGRASLISGRTGETDGNLQMPLTDDYGHELPTEDDAIAALAEGVGPETAEGLWDLSARALGVARPVTGAGDVLRVAEHLMVVGETARLTGRSLKVHAITYDALFGTAAL